MTHRKLTDRQGLFVREYLVDLNATQAAIRAGYARGSASRRGWALRRHPRVAAQINAALDDRARLVGITAERVLYEIALLGFANIKDYFEANEDGTAGLDPSALTREQAAAITEIQVEDPGAGAVGQGGRRGARRVKIKLADKSRNLELIGRHLGIFTRAPAREAAKGGAVQGDGVRGGAGKLSDIELAQRVCSILARGGKEG
ncbi:MAG: terminase small subunit [Pseudomonadota bacterium]